MFRCIKQHRNTHKQDPKRDAHLVAMFCLQTLGHDACDVDIKRQCQGGPLCCKHYSQPCQAIIQCSDDKSKSNAGGCVSLVGVHMDQPELSCRQTVSALFSMKEQQAANLTSTGAYSSQ